MARITCTCLFGRISEFQVGWILQILNIEAHLFFNDQISGILKLEMLEGEFSFLTESRDF